MSISRLSKKDIYSSDKRVGELVIEEVNGVRFATFYKFVDASQGKLRVPSGWATDQPHLSELMIFAADWDIDPDEARILLTEKSDGRQWLTTVGKFMEHGFHIDRGCGSQQALVDEHLDELIGGVQQWGLQVPDICDLQLGLDLK